MYIVKGEQHVFTNNGSYMQLLDTMKAHVKKKDTESIGGLSSLAGQAVLPALPSLAPSKDEVSTATLQSLAQLWHV